MMVQLSGFSRTTGDYFQLSHRACTARRSGPVSSVLKTAFHYGATNKSAVVTSGGI